MKKSHEVLLNSYEELKKSHENLKGTHEDLKETHENLKETHEKVVETHKSCLEHENKSKTSIGITCDILNNVSCASSSSMPSSSSNNISCTNDDFSCDVTLMVENDMLKNENEMLKHEIESLSYDLSRCYDGKNNLKHLLGCQKFSLNKEGLGYAPKKGKKAFATQKTNFVKNKAKMFIGECSKKNEVSFNIANSCYILKKNANGNVIAKFVGNPKTCAKKNAIWVPKVLVTNLQGPKQVWVPKRN